MLANIYDRCSIERIYPLWVFAVDAAENQRQPANELLKGIRILSAPDDIGAFQIERGSKHVGEVCGAAFMAPHRVLCALHAAAGSNDVGEGDTRAVAMSRMGQAYALANPDPEDGYKAFIDQIIAAAPRLGFRRDKAPGPGDVRLQGLRQ